jgi:oxygen-independent coproporphyrinogen-3 oxidase
VPFWKEHIDASLWKEVFKTQFHFGNARGMSLYIHLPFCESFCTYCGCNKKITTNHSVENVYMEALLKEWKMYTKLMGQRPVIRELHIGGGTPTFFSPENLKKLVTTILEDSVVPSVFDFSIEGHPNNTTKEHLQALYDIGFRRISYGVQDNDPEVQRVINRIQPFENVKRATEMAREIGYTSVNFDLIYGLPLQTEEKMRRTLEQSISLRPDRVAFYSYAHVPWTSRGQRLFDEKDLPSTAEKMNLYILGKRMFSQAGYSDIGMDHFALPGDELYNAWQEGRLHRNFMGYTVQHSALLLGIGVSSISDAGTAFAQNSKNLHDYYASIEKEELAVQKGYFLDEEDSVFRKHILDISCLGKTAFSNKFLPTIEKYSFPVLETLKNDGLVNYDNTGLQITDNGRNFIRNICSAFDLHLQRGNHITGGKNLFSKAI